MGHIINECPLRYDRVGMAYLTCVGLAVLKWLDELALAL